MLVRPTPTAIIIRAMRYSEGLEERFRSALPSEELARIENTSGPRFPVKPAPDHQRPQDGARHHEGSGDREPLQEVDPGQRSVLDAHGLALPFLQPLECVRHELV